MQKSGVVISILKTEKGNFQKLKIQLDNSKTEASCSINQPNLSKSSCGCGTSCAGCSGCGFAKNNSGLFVVNGNEVIALNKTNKIIKTGDLVLVEIDEKKVKKQAFLSLILPVILSITLSIIFFVFLRTEYFTILGFFLGLILGIIFAIFSNRLFGEAVLPEIL